MKLFLVLALAALAHGRPDHSKVDNRILSATKDGQTVDIFVTFKEDTQEVLQAIQDARFNDRADRLNVMHNSLVALASRVQAHVKEILEGKFQYTSLWITNQVYVKGATLELVWKLASRPEVKSITQEDIIALDYIVEGPVISGKNRQDPGGEWGIKMIQANEARNLLKNVSTAAAPVVISTIDTGVRYTHEALRDNWVGEYGWFDPYDKNALPMDLNGHGML